jgi:hypothetical protein
VIGQGRFSSQGSRWPLEVPRGQAGQLTLPVPAASLSPTEEATAASVETAPGSSKIAVSDRTTFGAFSQFVFNDRDSRLGKRLAPREMSDWMCVKGRFALF